MKALTNDPPKEHTKGLTKIYWNPYVTEKNVRVWRGEIGLSEFVLEASRSGWSITALGYAMGATYEYHHETLESAMLECQRIADQWLMVIINPERVTVS